MKVGASYSIYSVSQSADKGAYWWKNDSGQPDDFPQYTTSEVQDTLDFRDGHGLGFRILKLWREPGDVVNSQRHRAPHEKNPDYLDEFVHLGPEKNLSTHNSLPQAQTCQCKHGLIASERNETCCARFISHIAQYEPSDSELEFIEG
ncbi:hypothetical protein BDR04DRAFT_1232099 [Suillus decipiens]|nr:hypothetical protein BDR04DRAFT_1232099 [Suillus decipiens]